MKEIIYNIDNATAGRTITCTNLDATTMTKNNVLGIINKSTGDVLYTPLDWNNISSVTYSSGTLTIVLANTVPAITAGQKLFIKLYTDDAAGGYDELIANWLGITEATDYTALTQAEVIASTRAEQVNAWGEDGCPIPNYLPTGVTEAMVEAAATALGITYYEPNFNIATL